MPLVFLGVNHLLVKFLLQGVTIFYDDGMFGPLSESLVVSNSAARSVAVTGLVTGKEQSIILVTKKPFKIRYDTVL